MITICCRRVTYRFSKNNFYFLIFPICHASMFFLKTVNFIACKNFIGYSKNVFLLVLIFFIPLFQIFQKKFQFFNYSSKIGSQIWILMPTRFLFLLLLNMENKKIPSNPVILLENYILKHWVSILHVQQPMILDENSFLYIEPLLLKLPT